MSLEFIIGASGSGKTTCQQKLIIERAAAYPQRNFLVLVPEQFNMQTQIDIVKKTPNKGIMNIDILSFNRLAHRIFDEAGGNHRMPIDDCAKTMILRRIASAMQDRLTVLAGKMEQAGYIDEVKSVISELMQYRITPDIITAIIEKNMDRPALVNKLRDIQLLYQGFVDYLGEKYITAEELLDAAATVAANAGVLNDCEIYLDGYTGFTPVQLRFLEVLLKKSQRISVTVLLGAEMYSAGELAFAGKGKEEDLFAMSQGTIHSMLGIAKRVKAEVEPLILMENEVSYRFSNSPMLARLERELFRPALNQRANIADSDRKDIYIAMAGSVREEAAGICRTIRRLVKEKGYRYKDIAVLTGALEEYEGIMRQELERYEIPCFIDMRRAVLKNPLSELLRAIMDMILKSYSVESVLRYMRCEVSGFLPYEVDEIDNYITAVGIKRGSQFFSEWTRKTDLMTPEYAAEMEKLRQRFADMAAILREDIAPRKKQSCKDMLRAIYKFIHARGIYKYLMERSERLREAGDYSRASEYADIYEKLMELLDHIMEFLGDEQLSARELLEVIEAGLVELSVGLLPPGNDQVIIGDIKRSRLCDIKVLFLMGANDGLIPKDEHKMGILSEMDRQVLKDQEIELAPGTREQAFIQRFYLYMYMTKASERLYISYSRSGVDGTARQVSYVVGELLAMFPQLTVQDMSQNKITPITKSEGRDILTKEITAGIYDEELFLYFAREDSVYLAQIMEQAFKRYTGDSIQKAVAKALYGEEIRGSVTRLEKYAQCAYAHFLKYGLRLREREEYTFAVNDLGNIYHLCLQRFGELVKSKGYTFKTLTAGQCAEVCTEVLNQVLVREDNSAMYDTARSSYMEKRIRRIMERTAAVVTYQIQKGDFEPAGFEVDFGRGRFPAIDFELSEGRLSLNGIIDRIDVYKADGKEYFRIVDYKSGKKDFSFAALYDGVALQLPLYAAAAMKGVKDAEFGGMFYYYIDDPVLERGSEDDSGDDYEENLKARIYKELRLKGLVSSSDNMIYHMDKEIVKQSDVIPVELKKDGEVYEARSQTLAAEGMTKVVEFALDKAQETGNAIFDGKILAEPYGDNENNACDWCNYRSICGFDEYEPGYKYRKRSNKPKADIIRIIMGEAEEKEETE